MEIILASASPRRREILSAVCEKFDIKVSDTDESLAEYVHPYDEVRILAERKGRAVLDSFGYEASDKFIISSDTLVELSGRHLGKPESENDAKAMLLELSGKRHNVHTGIAIHYNGEVYSGVATTGVYFRDISEEEIEEYIATGEPMDKAGSYGIQGLGGKFVERIEGDFDTVVGFSVRLFLELASLAGCSDSFGKIKERK
ncbi:MAG: septum formation protein Maf [Ruminococcaceae bacterium]|nr:septum formation protein Maf [Oscillospiraceae bacterium]